MSGERPPRPRALITGASRGIGAAIALALAPDHDLCLSARSEAALADTAAKATQAGAKVSLHAADLSDAQSRARLLDALAELQIDLLINNAGVAESAPLTRCDDELWTRAIEINLRAPFELIRALAPKMGKRGWGRVVNVASSAALKGYSYTSAYSASKGGLVAMTRALAVEFARKGVCVNAVCPGFTDTDIVGAAVRNISDKTGQSSQEARAALAAFSPQGRLMSPSEVAALVAYLCSEAARGVSGQAIAIDGGETA